MRGASEGSLLISGFSFFREPPSHKPWRCQSLQHDAGRLCSGGSTLDRRLRRRSNVESPLHHRTSSQTRKSWLHHRQNNYTQCLPFIHILAYSNCWWFIRGRVCSSEVPAHRSHCVLWSASNAALQSQEIASAHLYMKQMLHFVFARKNGPDASEIIRLIYY